MKDIKIVIKCKGLCVRTHDLEMGLGILDQIAKHGIMNHVFISNKLLDKASDIIASAHDKIAGLSIIKKVQENFKMPEFAPSEEVNEETTKKLPGKRTRRSGIKSMSWTVEEDKLLCDLSKKTPSQIVKYKGLKRHTMNAIKTRLSIYRNEKFDRLNSDRANVMRAYLSGEQVTTPVVDINKNVSTPVVDKIYEDLKRDNDPKRKQKRAKAVAWTKEENEAISLNMNMTPKELKKLPWLKKRSTMQISNQKCIIKRKNEK